MGLPNTPTRTWGRIILPSSLKISVAKARKKTMQNDAFGFTDWPEIKFLTDSRFELVITNTSLDERKPSINDEGLQAVLFRKNSPLNFLDLTCVGLSKLYCHVMNLQNLTNLVLRSNSLVNIPDEITDIKSLKLLDLSHNAITNLPSAMGNLINLCSVNLSNNKVVFTNLRSLQILDVSYNNLEEFPSTLPHNTAKILLFNSNCINKLPEEISYLSDQLRTLNLSSNKLRDLPIALSSLNKLKDLDLTENKFVDKRFEKLACDKRHTASALIQYLKKKEHVISKLHKKKEIKNTESPSSEAEGKLNCSSKIMESSEKFLVAGLCGSDVVCIFLYVEKSANVTEIWPHILCCAVGNIFLDQEKLKNFFKLQKNLHNTDCGRRTRAYIDLHDFNKISLPLRYTALSPSNLRIVPFKKQNVLPGNELIAVLKAEANEFRRKNKKKNFSADYRYLHTVDLFSMYPSLIDSNNQLTTEARKILICVTSVESLSLCTNVMVKLLEFLTISNHDCSSLIVEQVKVYQANHELIAAFPDEKTNKLSPMVEIKWENLKHFEESMETVLPIC
ncbi:unnamed protein product [Dracunculus medinensis]|uniref:Leucine-rich repeat-containing protein 47 n=1 Tax=Dracunculus medinensis TaxID=318479 RepID=A0A0N4U7T4_DRAME|nr:unnamed protein product [Dracunculus medinensis]